MGDSNKQKDQHVKRGAGKPTQPPRVTSGEIAFDNFVKEALKAPIKTKK